MSTLTIRGIDDHLKTALRHRAAEHGRSMEAEVRAILHDALDEAGEAGDLGSRIHARFAEAGGAELEIPPRRPTARPVELPE